MYLIQAVTLNPNHRNLCVYLSMCSHFTSASLIRHYTEDFSIVVSTFSLSPFLPALLGGLQTG